MEDSDFLKEFEAEIAKIPDFIMNCPISMDWVEYNGVLKFAMINYEESIEKGKAMIDVCYCATMALNGRVEKTVPYSKRFKLKR